MRIVLFSELSLKTQHYRVNVSNMDCVALGEIEFFFIALCMDISFPQPVFHTEISWYKVFLDRCIKITVLGVWTTPDWLRNRPFGLIDSDCFNLYQTCLDQIQTISSSSRVTVAKYSYF